jgi:phage tail-like protein
MADFEFEQWPVAKFHFRVEVGDLGQISCQEVSGLESNTEVIEYRSGDSEIFSPIKMAGLVTCPNLTLKKAVFKDDTRLFELFNAMIEDKHYYSEANRMDCSVFLLDENGEEVLSWNIERAFPIKFTGPDLKSDANEIAIETIEFAYEQISIEEAG